MQFLPKNFAIVLLVMALVYSVPVAAQGSEWARQPGVGLVKCGVLYDILLAFGKQNILSIDSGLIKMDKLVRTAFPVCFDSAGAEKVEEVEEPINITVPDTYHLGNDCWVDVAVSDTELNAVFIVSEGTPYFLYDKHRDLQSPVLQHDTPHGTAYVHVPVGSQTFYLDIENNSEIARTAFDYLNGKQGVYTIYIYCY